MRDTGIPVGRKTTRKDIKDFIDISENKDGEIYAADLQKSIREI